MNHDAALKHVASCDECMNKIRDILIRHAAFIAGSATSAKKAKAARLNGLKGGRPRKCKMNQ